MRDDVCECERENAGQIASRNEIDRDVWLQWNGSRNSSDSSIKSSARARIVHVETLQSKSCLLFAFKMFYTSYNIHMRQNTEVEKVLLLLLLVGSVSLCAQAKAFLFTKCQREKISSDQFHSVIWLRFDDDSATAVPNLRFEFH